MTPRTSFWLKAASLVTVLMAVAGYMFCLSITSWQPENEVLLLHTNGYRWHFFSSVATMQRWTAGAAVILTFVAAGVMTRQLYEPLDPLPWNPALKNWPTLIAKGAVLSFSIWIALHQIFRMGEWEWFFVVTAVLGAAAILSLQRLTWFQHKLNRLMRIPYMPALMIGSTATLTIAFLTMHLGQAIVTDAQSQIAQARLILSGKFRVLLSEPLIQAAQLPNFSFTNPTYSQYPPGHILLLVPFIAAGLPANLLNILCGVISVYFSVRLSKLIAGRHAAIFTGLLLIASPFFLLMQSSAMNHGSTTMLVVLSSWAFYRVIWNHQLRLLWVGVLALSWAGITRPLTALAPAIIWGSVLAIYGIRSVYPLQVKQALVRHLSWRNIVTAVVAGVVPLVIMAIYNKLTTGHPLVMGYVASDSQMHRLGFRFSDPNMYTPVMAAHNLAADILSLSDHMFGWPFSSWLLLLGWLLFTRFSPGELVVAALIVTQFFLYRLYHFHDLILGPRFMSELMPFFAILGGVGLSRMFSLFSRSWRSVAVASVAFFLIAALVNGLSYWHEKLSNITTKHVQVRDFMKLPVSHEVPRVIVVRPEYGETAGEYVFDQDKPTWFISNKFEAAARLAPELKGYQWIRPIELN